MSIMLVLDPSGCFSSWFLGAGQPAFTHGGAGVKGHRPRPVSGTGLSAAREDKERPFTPAERNGNEKNRI